MYLNPKLKEVYGSEQLTARQAQEKAEWIAFGPIVFQVSRLMKKFGILDLLRDNDKGLTEDEVVQATGLSPYAVKVMLEASLCIGTVLVDTDTDRYSLSKTGGVSSPTPPPALTSTSIMMSTMKAGSGSRRL